MNLDAWLGQLPALSELFRLFLSGKHLNRLAEPALWFELEQQQDAYVALFAALGYDLRVDPRGFAWFHSAEASSPVSKTSRQLALLFMLIFDVQANAGKPLLRFSDWLLDRDWLAEAHELHLDMLTAEGIDTDGLADLLNRACGLGFARSEPSGWRLLPAVCRYLDHFEALARTAQGRDEDDTQGLDPDDEQDAQSLEEAE